MALVSVILTVAHVTGERERLILHRLLVPHLEEDSVPADDSAQHATPISVGFRRYNLRSRAFGVQAGYKLVRAALISDL